MITFTTSTDLKIGQIVTPTKITYASIVSFTSISIQNSFVPSTAIQAEQSTTWSLSSVAPTKSISIVTIPNDCSSCSAIRSMPTTSRTPISLKFVFVTSTVTNKSLHTRTTNVLSSKTFTTISASTTSTVVSTKTLPPKSSCSTCLETKATSKSPDTISSTSTSSCRSCHVSTSSIHQTSPVFQGSASHYIQLNRFAIGMSAFSVFIFLA